MANGLSEEQKSKAAQTRKATIDFKNSLNIPTMSDAIRDCCVECSGGSLRETQNCQVTRCPLFCYRQGKSPRSQDDIKKTLYDNNGKVIGYENVKGYRK